MNKLKRFAVMFSVLHLSCSAPSLYQFSAFPSISSTASSTNEQTLNADAFKKFSTGFKETESTKHKKEVNDIEYGNLFTDADSNKRSGFASADFTSFDETYSPRSSSSTPFPYTGKLNPGKGYSTQPNAENKVFVHHYKPHHHHHHHDHDDHHFVHDVVGHYITDVAGHKIKHVGEVLESGVLTEPIIHKLSFAKAALLKLLAIIGPLSAIKTLHGVAKASDHHHHHHDEHHGIIPAISGEHTEPHGHDSPTLAGILLHFVGQLSKFTVDAKQHLIPNLFKVVSHASSTSAHASGHHPH